MEKEDRLAAREREQSGQYSVRRSTPDDLLSERRMQAESWRYTYPNPDNGVSEQWVNDETASWLTDERIEKSRDLLKDTYDDPSQLRLVAQDGSVVVGFIHLARRGDGSIELKALYTDPETFGTGLGSMLLEQAEGWIGDAEVFLDVVAYNTRAIRFYKKHGFKKVEGSENLFREKLPCITMRREAK